MAPYLLPTWYHWETYTKTLTNTSWTYYRSHNRQISKCLRLAERNWSLSVSAPINLTLATELSWQPEKPHGDTILQEITTQLTSTNQSAHRQQGRSVWRRTSECVTGQDGSGPSGFGCLSWVKSNSKRKVDVNLTSVSQRIALLLSDSSPPLFPRLFRCFLTHLSKSHWEKREANISSSAN